MESVSPVFAALGVTGCEALNDLAHWLDGDREPRATTETSGWAGRWADQAMRAAGLAPAPSGGS
jgi:hypothetical protein